MQTTINLRILLTVVALLTGALHSAAHAQGAKRGKPAPEVYTGIIVKYKSAKFAPAGATTAARSRWSCHHRSPIWAGQVSSR